MHDDSDLSRQIIYMPYMPPFTRSEQIRDYTAACCPVEWRENYINSLDGTRIAICVGEIPPIESRRRQKSAVSRTKELVMLYFHGNGGSIPPRLPMLSSVLKAIAARADDVADTHYSLVVLSYRGYWSSSGKATQTGIEKDAQAVLRWINTTYLNSVTGTTIVLWGQSIGAGVASTAAAEYVVNDIPRKIPLAGLIMETPFTSIKAMLLSLYPQKWLPYKYLWPFLWNNWDSEAALRRIAACPDQQPRILLVSATRDEVVPPEEADKLEKLCRLLGLDVQRRDVLGSLHTEATTRREGQEAVASFIVRLSSNR